MMQLEPELLSPAGNWDCARAAVANGADAIFFGLPKYNARLRADNFTEEDLPRLMSFLHQHGVKGFVTMNTLVFSDELEGAVSQLQLLQESGVDAIIVQDIGLAYLATKVAPKLELHASTQMTITSAEGLEFVEQFLPLDRAVLARELSLKEIERFGEEQTSLEVFVHGALCVAYSGQCLTSESLGQRSANRGECAQACRMPYQIIVDGVEQDLKEVRYLLSPQDLAAVDMIPGLIKAGVKSYKIEGRLKSPEYVAGVTAVYRKAIDASLAEIPIHEAVSEEDRHQLEMTFSRGLSSGWLAGTNHPYLTHGKFGKKRGALVGTITHVGEDFVDIDSNPPFSLTEGDGIVFDAGEDRNHEQGGRLFRVTGTRLWLDRRAQIQWDHVRPGQQIWKTDDPKINQFLRKSWKSVRLESKGHPLHITVSGSLGNPLELLCEGHRVHTDHSLEAAEKHDLDSELLEKQLSRLGDTPYQLSHLDSQLPQGLTLPISSLNRARRSLIHLLDQNEKERRTLPSFSLSEHLPKVPQTKAAAETSPQLSVLCRNLQQLDAALEAGVDRIYCDYEDLRDYRPAMEKAQSLGMNDRIHLATPRIQKPGEDGYFKLIERLQPGGVLLRNLGSIQHFRNHQEIKRVLDFSLNISNPVSAEVLRQQSEANLLTCSYDLNLQQVLGLLKGAPAEWFEVTLHQHMPLFHMEHCVFCTFMSKGTSYKDCGRPCEKHEVMIKDRVGQLHPLKADVGCRNTLFNGRAQTGALYFSELLKAGAQNFRVELLSETKEEAGHTIKAYQQLLSGKQGGERLWRTLGATEQLGVTQGTLEKIREEKHSIF